MASHTLMFDFRIVQSVDVQRTVHWSIGYATRLARFFGTPQRLASMHTIADGLAAPFVGTHTLAHCKAFVDEWHVVPDNEIVDGMRVLMERCKLFPESAAGAAIVPLLTNRLSLSRDDVVVPIICGGNIDIERLKQLL